METGRRVFLVALLVVCCCAWPAKAEIIQIGLTAEVVGVDNPELIDGQLGAGDLITGIYTYDSDTVDSNPLSDVGDYRYYSPPYGVELTGGGFVFQSDPDNTNFILEVTNNHHSDGSDYYLVGSYNNLPLSNGTEVNHISWQLDDDSGTVLSSTAILLGPPVLQDWDYHWQLMIRLGPKGQDGLIGVEVTSVWLVPEPSSVLLLGLGFAAFVRRRRRFCRSMGCALQISRFVHELSESPS